METWGEDEGGQAEKKPKKQKKKSSASSGDSQTVILDAATKSSPVSGAYDNRPAQKKTKNKEGKSLVSAEADDEFRRFKQDIMSELAALKNRVAELEVRGASNTGVSNEIRASEVNRLQQLMDIGNADKQEEDVNNIESIADLIKIETVDSGKSNEGKIDVTLHKQKTGFGKRPRLRFKRGQSKLPEWETYQAVESVWDVALVVGTADTIIDFKILIIAIIINAFVQILFCFIVYLNIASTSPITSSVLAGVLEWRVAVGHDAKHFDRSTGTSLVTRICSGAKTTIMGAEQMQMYDLLGSYRPSNLETDDAIYGMIGGPTLCGLSVTIWLIKLTHEILHVMDWIRATLSLTIRRGRTQLDEENDTCKIVSVSVSRFIFCLFIGLVRLFIAVFLCYTGVLFLAHTFNLEDLMVNAIMLAFILEMDEFIFENTAPTKFKDQIQKMEPLPISKRLMYPGRNAMDPRPALIVLTVVVALAIFIPFKLWPEIQNVMDTQRLLCDGDQDFIFALDRATGIATVTDTASYSSPGHTSYAFQAVLQRTKLLDMWGGTIPTLDKFVRPTYNISAWSARPNKVVDMLTETTAQSINALPCIDTLDANTSAMRALQDIYGSQSSTDHWIINGRFAAGARVPGRPASQNITSCTNLQDQCESQLVRSLCPKTCSCDDPVKVNFDAAGCPSACALIVETRRTTSRMRMRNGGGECSDTLNSTYVQNWVLYWENFQEYMKELGYITVQTPTPTPGTTTRAPQSTTATTTIVTWGALAMQHIGLGTNFAYTLTDFGMDGVPGLNLSHIALKAYQAQVSASESATCKFAEFIPKIFNFDPCRDDNKRSSTSVPFGSLQGLCPLTCNLLTHCEVRRLTEAEEENEEENTTVTTVAELEAEVEDLQATVDWLEETTVAGTIRAPDWATLYGVADSWRGLNGLNFMAAAEADQCTAYSGYICEWEMTQCAAYATTCADFEFGDTLYDNSEYDALECCESEEEASCWACDVCECTSTTQHCRGWGESWPCESGPSPSPSPSGGSSAPSPSAPSSSPSPSPAPKPSSSSPSTSLLTGSVTTVPGVTTVTTVPGV